MAFGIRLGWRFAGALLEDENHPHTKEMDMGPLEGPNKLIAHVKRLALWVGDGR